MGGRREKLTEGGEGGRGKEGEGGRVVEKGGFRD